MGFAYVTLDLLDNGYPDVEHNLTFESSFNFIDESYALSENVSGKVKGLEASGATGQDDVIAGSTFPSSSVILAESEGLS